MPLAPNRITFCLYHRPQKVSVLTIFCVGRWRGSCGLSIQASELEAGEPESVREGHPCRHLGGWNVWLVQPYFSNILLASCTLKISAYSVMFDLSQGPSSFVLFSLDPGTQGINLFVRNA